MTDLAALVATAVECEEAIRLADEALRAALAARESVIPGLRANGLTQKETASFLGISHQRVSQLERAGWEGMPTYTPAERLRDARDAYAMALHAQKLREERYAMGYKTETAAFYGDTDAPASDDAEQRVRWEGFHVGLDRERAEAS